MSPKSHHFSSLLASQNAPKNLKKDFWAPEIRFLCFFVMRIFQKQLFYLSENAVFEVSGARKVFWNSWFVMFFQKSDFWGVQSSLFSILLGSGDLQNRLWSSKVSVSLQREHGFQKTMFYRKNDVLKKCNCYYISELQNRSKSCQKWP